MGLDGDDRFILVLQTDDALMKFERFRCAPGIVASHRVDEKRRTFEAALHAFFKGIEMLAHAASLRRNVESTGRAGAHFCDPLHASGFDLGEKCGALCWIDRSRCFDAVELSGFAKLNGIADIAFVTPECFEQG